MTGSAGDRQRDAARPRPVILRSAATKDLETTVGEILRVAQDDRQRDCHPEERSDEGSRNYSEEILRVAQDDRQRDCHPEERSDEGSRDYSEEILRVAHDDRQRDIALPVSSSSHPAPSAERERGSACAAATP